MSSDSDSGTVFYVSVSHGTTVLADFVHPRIVPAAAAGGGDLAALGASCLEAVPRFHLLYTHTANRRIYAFLIGDRVRFFAIADDSLGRSAVILFLHRLRDATIHPAQRRLIAGDPLPHHCLQEELLPVIRRLVASFFTRSPSEGEKPYISPPHALPSPFLSSTPPSSDSHLLTGEHKRKLKKERKKNARSEEGLGVSLSGNGVELSVLDNDGDADLELGSGSRKSLHRIWRRQVRLILVIDAVVCTILFGIWLSICKGFQCIG